MNRKPTSTKHGMTGTSTFNIWTGMKHRCDNPGSQAYAYYGGRGISYDPRWREFPPFLEDMGLRPAGLTLERIDVNGNYCKNNCRWASRKEQQRNRRDNAVVGGVRIVDVQDDAPVGRTGLVSRLARGLSEKEALSRPAFERDLSSKTAKYPGVSFCLRDNKWFAYVKVHGKMYNLGRHKTQEEARDVVLAAKAEIAAGSFRNAK